MKKIWEVIRKVIQEVLDARPEILHPPPRKRRPRRTGWQGGGGGGNIWIGGPGQTKKPGS